MCRASKSCFGNKSLETTTVREVQNGRFNNETMAKNLCFSAMLNDCMEERNFFSAKSLLFPNCQDLMRFIGDFQRESCRKPLPLSTAAWLAQQKSDGLLSGRSRFQTLARTNTQGLRELGRKFCLCNDICKWLDLLVFSDKNEKSQAPSNSPCRYNKILL